MALQIIGAGFGRTGTLSLKGALEQLGFAKCHHMLEVFEHPAQAPAFRDAARGEPIDWDALFSGYLAMVDWPGSYFWKELADYYPHAKVLLSVRRSADEWFDSATQTIFSAMNRMAPAGVALPPEILAQREMALEIVVNRTFGGNIHDRAHCTKIYLEHIERVQREIAPERLLIFEASQGWEPLCRFVGKPVPASEFPRVNSRDEFLARLAAR